MKTLLAFIILSFPAFALSGTWNEEMVCGNTEIQVQISEQEKGIKIWEVTITAKSKFSRNQAVSLYFEQVYFKHGCQNTKSGKQFYVFQAYCSGSACHDEDNWGIIDNNANLILAPYKKNQSWKGEILNNN